MPVTNSVPLQCRVDLGSWEGCNFYQIRPASKACNFYKIRPEIWDQLLRFEARFQKFSAAFGGRFGVKFSTCQGLDLGPVQDFGIPVREHMKTSKNEFWGGSKSFPFGLQAPVSSVYRAVLDMPCREAARDWKSAWRAAFTALWPGPQLLQNKPPP